MSISENILDNYVGRYDRGEAGDSAVTVTREGQTLVVRSSMYPPRVLKPTSETQFFDKVGGEWSFNRDPAGKVTDVVLRPPRGELVKLPKIK